MGRVLGSLQRDARCIEGRQYGVNQKPGCPMQAGMDEVASMHGLVGWVVD